jgi:hypothetical protein
MLRGTAMDVSFFMRTNAERKYAAKAAASGARVVEKAIPLLACLQDRYRAKNSFCPIPERADAKL